jgi:hypothetical protein
MTDPILAAIEERLAALRTASTVEWSKIDDEKLTTVLTCAACEAVKFDFGLSTTAYAKERSEEWAGILKATTIRRCLSF